jgi:hypothetical protein
MGIRSLRAGKLLSLIFGVITLGDVVLLLVLDVRPGLFPEGSHAGLAAFALATIAVAYLMFQWTSRQAPMELAKAMLLAAAFLFWAANQFWPDLPQAGLFNDIAIGLFVLDVFFVISGWPGGSAAKASTLGGNLAACDSEKVCGCRKCCRRLV